jgi:hypothetical protein
LKFCDEQRLTPNLFRFADALAAVMEACKPGAKIVDLCEKGDSFMVEYVTF